MVGAFFAHDKDKAREQERVRRLAMVTEWLSSGGPAPEALVEMQHEMRARLPVFHWMVEFPEVFYAERPDPLDADAVNRAAWMDAFVGNPPFMGGSSISGQFGNSYLAWLLMIHEPAHGNADLSAHFFRRTTVLLGEHGTAGLIGTNTIAQGDTRVTGLQYLMDHGAVAYEATDNMMWPGDAAVSVSIVHLARGRTVGEVGMPRLNGRAVREISSQLASRAERRDPAKLAANSGIASQGSKIYGQGFLLSHHERETLVAMDLRNATCVFPYLGGDELNMNPKQGYDRFVISFHGMTLDEASQWPHLLELVRSRVKPDRDCLRDDNASARVLKAQWWRFQAHRPALYESIAPLKRCLVTARVSKHLMFCFQPTERVFSEQLYVFPLAASSAFATLQSRIHEGWARLLSSSLEDRLRYAASDCFETFPFPQSDPRAVIPALEDIGKRLYDARAQYMIDENVGLTVMYNRLKDPKCSDARVVELRGLHEEMDRAVLAAYAEGDPEGRWGDVVVPPFCVVGEGDKGAVAVFEDGVIDRLFALNARRAAGETVGKLVDGSGKRGGAKKRAAKAKSAEQLDLVTDHDHEQTLTMRLVSPETESND